MHFIESAQWPDGAIAIYPGSTNIDPYGADYAAMGLARAAALTGDATAANDAWRYLEWYQRAEGPSGVVTNATEVSSKSVRTGSVDSTDATAGLFIVAAEETWNATHDRARLERLAPAIPAALSVIESTQDSDGLTWALASYHAKYLMDQSEAYAGFEGAAVLGQVLGEAGLTTRAQADAARMANGVANLWDPATNAYDWAVAGDGNRAPTLWKEIYPDGLEQIWAVAFGVASPAHAATIVSTFLTSQPEWADPGAFGHERQGASIVDVPVGYWPLAVWALDVTGHFGLAANGQASITAWARSNSSDWPYTPSTAGQLIVGFSLGAGMSVL